jgi:hypothetical protein
MPCGNARLPIDPTRQGYPGPRYCLSSVAASGRSKLFFPTTTTIDGSSHEVKSNNRTEWNDRRINESKVIQDMWNTSLF